MGLGAILLVCVAPVIARGLTEGPARGEESNPFGPEIFLVCVGGMFLLWLAAAAAWRGVGDRFSTQDLATIGLFGSLQWAVSYAALLFNSIAASMLGPFATYVSAIANEGLRCLVLAALIVLLPRAGTFFLASVTVFLLNSLFTGTLGLSALMFITTNIVVGETLLFVLGVTRGNELSKPGRFPSGWTVVRVALAIGLANVAKYYAQFALSLTIFRFQYDAWFIHSAALTSLFYAGVGAAFGTPLGYRLRSVAR